MCHKPYETGEKFWPKHFTLFHNNSSLTNPLCGPSCRLEYEMHKLKHQQLLHLTKGKYHDGKGLYISITSPRTGKWSYRYRID